MWRWTNFASAAALAQITLAPQALAQFKVEFPPDAPLAVVSGDWGSSRVTPRGSALVVELRTALQLKNNSSQRIRGVTLLVTAAELTAGGKASVTVPSLDVKPGETFPVRIDLRLLRPNAGSQAAVQVALDGVLFDTLAFYGENKLNSRRMMLAWELEARRDRQYWLETLAQGGPVKLQQEMVAAVARMDAMPQLDVQVVRGRSTSLEPGPLTSLAALDTPGAPVEILNGQAGQVANELRSPSFEIRNRSANAIRFVELGWSSKESAGGAFPADVTLSPGQRGRIQPEVTLRLPAALTGLSAFVTKVEFGDGSMWVPPGRSSRRISPEEQRLTELYRRKGLDALVAELKRFE